MLLSDDVITPDWPAPPGISALFTTRLGGVSTGVHAGLNLGLHVGDDPIAVQENRRRLVAVLPVEPLWLNQVHGTVVANMTAPARRATAPVADSVVTALPGQPCAVMVADCLPVLFCDFAGSRIGAAHAGWRGLAAGVIENTVAAMQTSPAELMAWLGPAIGPQAFEVGEDVVAAFAAHSPASIAAFHPIAHQPGKYLADLYSLARERLRLCGVHAVHGGGFCTYSDPARFFSHRRDGCSGRMAAVIWRESVSPPC